MHAQHKGTQREESEEVDEEQGEGFRGMHVICFIFSPSLKLVLHLNQIL